MYNNITIFNGLRKKYPTFASHTSEATAATFTERGFEAFNSLGPEVTDELYTLLLRVAFRGIDQTSAKDDLEESGFGETYDVPFGEIIQKMAVYPMKPISPQYRNLRNGQSVDQQKIRMGTIKERFWKQNFDYQSCFTIPDDYTRKTIFLSEYGFSEYAASIVNAAQTGWIIQKYENKLEAINNGFLHSKDYPLQESQKYNWVVAGDTPTVDELANLLLLFANVKEAMKLGPQTDAFNAYKFPCVTKASDLKILMRPGYKNMIQNIPALNRPGLELPEIITVNDFGGLEHYKDAKFTTKLYPHYDEFGAEDGWSESKGGNLYTGEVFVKDPNADVVAIMADKGLLFMGVQSPYTVESAPHNAAGKYTTFWPASPGNTVAVDSLKNGVVFYKTKQ